MTYEYPCPVCSSPVKYETDYMENVLMEEYGCCLQCGLYSSEYCTGHERCRIGFWLWGSSWMDTKDSVRARNQESKVATELTRELIADPEWPLWKRVTEVWPEKEPELFRAFSDFNRDKGRDQLADQVLVFLGEFLK